MFFRLSRSMILWFHQNWIRKDVEIYQWLHSCLSRWETWRKIRLECLINLIYKDYEKAIITWDDWYNEGEVNVPLPLPGAGDSEWDNDILDNYSEPLSTPTSSNTSYLQTPSSVSFGVSQFSIVQVSKQFYPSLIDSKSCQRGRILFIRIREW